MAIVQINMQRTHEIITETSRSVDTKESLERSERARKLHKKLHPDDLKKRGAKPSQNVKPAPQAKGRPKGNAAEYFNERSRYKSKVHPWGNEPHRLVTNELILQVEELGMISKTASFRSTNSRGDDLVGTLMFDPDENQFYVVSQKKRWYARPMFIGVDNEPIFDTWTLQPC